MDMGEKIKKYDPDVYALELAVQALQVCTSKQMVRATIHYLVDRFLYHPGSGVTESVCLPKDKQEE